MIKNYDIVIIGGGPAGATLARLIKNKSILIISSDTQDKPCGGLLAPDAQKALAVFDLTLPKEVLVDPQIFSVRTMDLESGIEKWYQRMYINMDRNRFDKWLLSLVPDTVDRIDGRCMSIHNNEITYISNGVEGKVTADVIVGADGANSIVRKTFFKSFKTRQYVAIQQWFENDESQIKPFYSCIFDEKTSDCCSWSINKDGYLIFGGAFAPQNCRENFEKQKKRLERFDIKLSDPIKTEACQVLRPINTRSFVTGKEFDNHSVYLIGEAAGFISPSSLEGFSSAFNSAIYLSDSLDQKHPLKSYNKKTRKLKVKLLLKNIKSLFMYHPLLRKIVMKSGIDTITVRK